MIVQLVAFAIYLQVKCEKYWPELGLSETHGQIDVHTDEENIINGIVQRKITLRKNEVRISVNR